MISACHFALTPELIIAIATLALAVVTAWMALETRRTAAAALKALEFEQMPILGFRDLKINVPGASQDSPAGYAVYQRRNRTVQCRTRTSKI
jgi:CDP-diacylglycerol pyrophosphatase